MADNDKETAFAGEYKEYAILNRKAKKFTIEEKREQMKSVVDLEDQEYELCPEYTTGNFYVFRKKKKDDAS